MGLASNVLLRNEEARKSSSSSSYPFFHMRESSSKTAATVEEDLDSALDEILGSAFKEAGDDSAAASLSVSVVDTETEVEADTEADTEVVAAASEVEEKEAIPVDFTNPKFLSTTNPYWVNAGMEQKVIDVLSGKGITRFTEVQGKAFEPVLEGRDVIGRSRTGTGKTLAFGLPGAHRLVIFAEEEGGVDSQGRRKRGRNVSMIALCPTRELARQVEEEISHVARPLGLFTTVFHGGVSYDPQVRIIIY
jgi:ATP-dependent RNA helicase DDX21